jgi:hypothetical protein
VWIWRWLAMFWKNNVPPTSELSAIIYEAILFSLILKVLEYGTEAKFLIKTREIFF